MDKEAELKEINKQVETFESALNKALVPILQDTISDGNEHNKKLFILAMFMLIIVLVTSLFSGYLIYKQNIKYQEFLSQFEFETEVYQDAFSDNNSSTTINDGIRVDK